MGVGFNDLSMMIGSKPMSSASQETTTSLPSYWKNAIDTMAPTIKKRQKTAGYQAFQFVWFSDLHGVADQKTDDTITSRVTHIGSIAQYTAEKFDIPLVAISGDIMSQGSHGNVSSVYNEYKQIRELLAPIDRDKLLMVKGNHDGAWGSPVTINGVATYYLYNIGQRAIFNEIYRRQALEYERVFGGNGTYFYVDSPQNVRFIMLNSFTDGDSSVDENGYAVYNPMKVGCAYGTEQLEWVADVALDVPEGWSIVVMGHAPFSYGADATLLAGILDAYNNRTSYSNSINMQGTYWGNGVTDTTYTHSTVSADFSNAKGEIVGFFYGHTHYDSIASDNTFPGIGITTAGADVRGVNLNYPRVVGTATETALDIVTIDMLNKKIYCDRLGAGEATRLVGYGIDSDPIVTYTVANNLINCTNSNSATSVTEGASYSATIKANSGYVLDSVSVTMGDTAVAVSDGVISIASVTGDIVITAVAMKDTNEGGTTSYTNILTSSFAYNGTDYDAIGYEDGMRLSTSAGNTKAADGRVTTGFIPVSAGDVVRIKGMTLPSSNDGSSVIAKYDENKAFISGQATAIYVGCASLTYLPITYSEGFITIEVTKNVTLGFAYIRVTGQATTGADCVVTINEELT